jgi:hypothetical protein
MYRSRSVVTAWCSVLGVMLLAIFVVNEALTDDLPLCDKTTEPPPDTCGEVVDCNWFDDTDGDGELEWPEQVYQYPDTRCGGVKIEPLENVVTDCIDGESYSTKCKRLKDENGDDKLIDCTKTHMVCDWVDGSLEGTGPWACLPDHESTDVDGNPVKTLTETSSNVDCREEF